MKKVVVFNDHWCSGGVESLWSNIINSIGIDERIEFTILASQKETNIYDHLLQKNNVNLITVLDDAISNPIKRTRENMKRIKLKLKELMPDILHINSCNASGLKIAAIAKKIGIKTVIVHSHNTKIEHDKLKIKSIAHLFWRMKYVNKPNYYFSCSTEAGIFMFKKKNIDKLHLVNNGVDTTKFDYNLGHREEIRKKYGLANEFVIGHIGRFCEQKNHKFLVDVFEKVHKLDSSIRLMLVGEGELKEAIFATIKEKGLTDFVIDCGITNEAYKYYSAFDTFVLPSFHEGLPVVAVEAQASGLPVILASTITTEAKILETTNYLNLASADLWALEILKLKTYYRCSKKEEIINGGFDILNESKKLLKFYLEN